MITAAVYEQEMKLRLDNIRCGTTSLQAEKAIVETMDVLRCFGYDAGADIFFTIMHETIKGNVVKNIDV